MAELLGPREADLEQYGYRRLSFIGRGQFASAYLVQHIQEEKRYVAKVVFLDGLNERDQRLAQQEVDVLKVLRHPHIVEYKESFLISSNEKDGRQQRALVIIMEFCEGGDLRELIQKRAEKGLPLDHFSEQQIMHWFVQILLALHQMHKQKILHRDLKTSNLFLSQDHLTLKIGDFGISRILEGTTEAAATIVGTPYYMSPEVCRNEPYRDKSDIWALGCVLYEMCMLKHAFESNSLMGLIYRIVMDSYDPIPSIYTQDVSTLVSRLLAKSADGRPSASEIFSDAYVRQFLMQVRGLSRTFTGPSQGPVMDERPNYYSNSNPSRDRTNYYARNSQPGSAQSLEVRRGPLGAPIMAFEQGGSDIMRGTTPNVHPGLLTDDIRGDAFFELLMWRARRALTKRGRMVNWLRHCARFDKGGRGVLEAHDFESALTSMHLGLSAEELGIVTSRLSTRGGRVKLTDFAEALDAAPGRWTQLTRWATLTIQRIADAVASGNVPVRGQNSNSLDALLAALGPKPTLSASEVEQKLCAVMPSLPPEEAKALTRLVPRSLGGDLDWAAFVNDLLGGSGGFGSTGGFGATGGAGNMTLQSYVSLDASRGTVSSFVSAREDPLEATSVTQQPTTWSPFGTCVCLSIPGAKSLAARRLARRVIARRVNFSHALAIFSDPDGSVAITQALAMASAFPLGLSRSEVQLLLASTPASGSGDGVAAKDLEALVNAAAKAGDPWDPPPTFLASSHDSKEAVINFAKLLEDNCESRPGPSPIMRAVCAEADFRTALVRQSAGLTPAQLDRCVDLADKDGDGDIAHFDYVAELRRVLHADSDMNAPQFFARPATPLRAAPLSGRPFRPRPLSTTLARHEVSRILLARLRRSLARVNLEGSVASILQWFSDDALPASWLKRVLVQLPLGISQIEAAEMMGALMPDSASRQQNEFADHPVAFAHLQAMLDEVGAIPPPTFLAAEEAARTRLRDTRGTEGFMALISDGPAGTQVDSEWLAESEFRTVLSQLDFDTSSGLAVEKLLPGAADHELDLLVLLAEKNTNHDIHWPSFLDRYGNAETAQFPPIEGWAGSTLNAMS